MDLRVSALQGKYSVTEFHFRNAHRKRTSSAASNAAMIVLTKFT
jgi:hypothetical protein